ncbi:MAG TPA: FAD-dependent monooxygenase [Polyangiales bacterium]
MRTDISDRPPLPRWGEGPVSLLGDAAHPMTPNLGQGACQAIEDAYVITRELSGTTRLAEGLARYEQARLARANAVVVTARRFGAVGQWRGAFACWLRDGLFGALPSALTLRQLREAWRLP